MFAPGSRKQGAAPLSLQAVFSSPPAPSKLATMECSAFFSLSCSDDATLWCVLSLLLSSLFFCCLLRCTSCFAVLLCSRAWLPCQPRPPSKQASAFSVPPSLRTPFTSFLLFAPPNPCVQPASCATTSSGSLQNKESQVVVCALKQLTLHPTPPPLSPHPSWGEGN